MRSLLYAIVLALPVFVACGVDFLPKQATIQLTVVSGMSPYTTEEHGYFVVQTAFIDQVEAKLTCTHSESKVELVSGCPLKNKERSRSCTFNLSHVVMDTRARVDCKAIDGKGNVVAEAHTSLARFKHEQNVVKVDGWTNGLIVDGLPFVPMGFYNHYTFKSQSQAPRIGDGVWGADTMVLDILEVHHGFRHTAPYISGTHSDAQIKEIIDIMDDLDAAGMKIHYDLSAFATMDDTESKWEAMKAQINAVKHHPALLTWYLSDEPDGQGISPAALEKMYAFVKGLDALHPISLCYMGPDHILEFIDSTDVMIHDPYPIPNGPVTSVADNVQHIYAAVNATRPLWVAPQAFGGGEWWSRQPSGKEGRVMSYLALMNGVVGLQYFVRVPPNAFPSSSRLWSELGNVATEVNELTLAILNNDDVRTFQASSSVPAVRCTALSERGDAVVLCANTENIPVPFAVKLDDFAAATEAVVMFENRKANIASGVISDVIGGMDTMVFRVSKPANPLKAVLARLPTAGNLLQNPSFEDMFNVGTPDGFYFGAGVHMGSNAFVDSRLAKDGMHSLRVTTGADNSGMSMSPYPIMSIKTGMKFVFKIWVRNMADGVQRTLSVTAPTIPFPSFKNPVFAVEGDGEWHQFSSDVMTAEKDCSDRNCSFSLSAPTKGTIWIDMMEFEEA